MKTAEPINNIHARNTTGDLATPSKTILEDDDAQNPKNQQQTTHLQPRGKPLPAGSTFSSNQHHQPQIKHHTQPTESLNTERHNTSQKNTRTDGKHAEMANLAHKHEMPIREGAGKSLHGSKPKTAPRTQFLCPRN